MVKSVVTHHSVHQKEVHQLLMTKASIDLFGPSVVAREINTILRNSDEVVAGLPIQLLLSRSNLRHLTPESKTTLSQLGLIDLDASGNVITRLHITGDSAYSVDPSDMRSILIRLGDNYHMIMDSISTGTDISQIILRQTGIIDKSKHADISHLDDGLIDAANKLLRVSKDNINAELKCVSDSTPDTLFISSTRKYNEVKKVDDSGNKLNPAPIEESNFVMRPLYKDDFEKLLIKSFPGIENTQAYKKLLNQLPQDSKDLKNAILSAEDAGLSSIDRLMRDHIQFFEKIGFRRSELENKDLIRVIFNSGDPFNGRPSFLIKEFDSGIPAEVSGLYNKLTPIFRERVGKYLFPDSGTSLSNDERLIVSLFTYNYFLRIENRIDTANLYQLFIDRRHVVVEDYGLTLNKNGNNLFRGAVPDEADVGSNIPNSIINKNIGKYQDADKITVHPFNVESVENLANTRHGAIPQKLTDQELSHLPGVNVVRIEGEQIFLITDLESARSFKMSNFNGEWEITIGFTHKLEWSEAQNRYIRIQLSELELSSVGTTVHRIQTLDDLTDLRQAISIYTDHFSNSRVHKSIFGKFMESAEAIDIELKDGIREIILNRKLDEPINFRLSESELREVILPILNGVHMNHILANGFRKNAYNAITRGDASLSSSYRVAANGEHYKSPATNSLFDINTGSADLISDARHLDAAFGPGHYQGSVTIISPTKSSFDPLTPDSIISTINNFEVKTMMPDIANKIIENLNLGIREAYAGKHKITHNTVSMHRSKGTTAATSVESFVKTDARGKVISVDGKPIEFKYLSTEIKEDSSIADILKIIRKMNKGAIADVNGFLQFKTVQAKQIMEHGRIKSLDQINGRVFIAVLHEIAYADSHYKYLRQLLEDAKLINPLKRLFEGESYTIKQKDREVLNEVVEIFIERRSSGFSTSDYKIINAVKHKYKKLMLEEVRDDFSYVFPQTRISSNAFDDVFYAIDGIIPMRDQDTLLMKAQNFASPNFMQKHADGSYRLKVNTNAILGEPATYHPRTLQNLVDEAMEPYRPKDSSGQVIPDKLPTGRELTAARTAEASEYSTIRNLFIPGAYMDVKYIVDYYNPRLSINIIQQITELRKSTEFKNIPNVSDEELLWRIFISDVIGLDRSSLVKYSGIPHPSTFDPDFAKNLAEIKFKPNYKYNEIGNYDVRTLFDRNFKIKAFRDPGGSTLSVVDRAGNRVGLAYENHNHMTISDLGLPHPHSGTINSRTNVPKESTIFYDRMYYANLLETRMISQAQYSEFVTAWAELIAVTTRAGDDQRSLQYLFRYLDTIEPGITIRIETESSVIRLVKANGEELTFIDNTEFAKHLAERYAPPTMYRDHVSGKWVKTSPESQVYRQANTDGSNNKPMFWLYRIYQDGPVRIYVEGTPEARFFREQVEAMIKFYDDLLNGDISLLMQLKAHETIMRFGRHGTKMIFGVGDFVKELDSFILRSL
jgi:hypothetical protein